MRPEGPPTLAARSAARWTGAKRRPLDRREAPAARSVRSAVRQAVSEPASNPKIQGNELLAKTPA